MKDYRLMRWAAATAMVLCTATAMDAKDVESVKRPVALTVEQGAPLQRLMLEKLPAGAIEPEGWLLRQCELQRDGLNGHLGEISAWLDKNNNAWLVEGGDRGWEEVPYWLRGYSHLAYLLKDE